MKNKDGKLSWIERQFFNIFLNRLIKKIDNMKGSWKTTVMGVLTLIGAVALAGKSLLDGDPTTNPDFNEILLALAGLGLWAARDNSVTSKQAGAE